MLDWHGCYGKGWQGLMHPDAFTHPAKFSRALIRRIYEHAFERGWLKAGDTALDPFGGVALGALHAMRRGLHWVGVELEQKFVNLGQQNIDLWNDTYAAQMPGWGSATLLQGDSRELAALLRGRAGGCVSSPPYSTGIPVQDTKWFKVHREIMGRDPNAAGGTPGHYGITNGNLGNLRATDADHAAALPQGLVSSPPYTSSLASDDPDKRGGLFRDPRRRNDKTLTAEYGKSAGQLGTMPEGDLAGLVSSPPYEGSLDNILPRSEDGKDDGAVATFRRTGKWPERRPKGLDYGISAGQIGIESGDTFWSAACAIVEQTHQVLAPGAVTIWVCKRFVRKGKIVPFPTQWAQMCEACGFETVEWIRVWLVEDRGAQYALNGDLVKWQVARKSFFRRLAEQKGSPRIDWEDVICMRKAVGAC